MESQNRKKRSDIDAQELAKRREYDKKYREKNRQRVNRNARNWAIKNRHKVRKIQLDWLYGISVEAYNDMVLKQDNKCALCFKPSNRRLDVDHDHKTGKIRGLLCGKCNKGLGLFYDDIDVFKRAVVYLSKKD